MFRDDPSVLTRQEVVVSGHAQRGISARTKALYDSVRSTKPRLAVDRARLMTESFARTQGQSMVLRWARALEHIAQHIPLFIAPDELIVGRAAGFAGRYVIFYSEVDGAYAAEAVELLAARKEASIAVTDDDKLTVKAIGAAWQGKTFTESYVASLPEETRHLFFGADKANLSKQTFVGMQAATLRNSQNWTHDYAKVLKRGFKGLREDAASKLAALADPAQLAEKAPFLQAVIITCDAIVTFARRYSALAAGMAERESDAQRKRELQQIAATCTWVPENPARGFREALRIMEDKRYGKIVNISSIAGISGLTAHNSAYSAAKAGVVGFTKAVAIEVIGANVNVNCIAAGGITTPGLQKMVDSSPQMRERMVQAIPQGRLGEVDEYASLALYLASDDAAYMVGQVLSPNGGCVV